MKTYKYPFWYYTDTSAKFFFNRNKRYGNIMNFIISEGVFSSIIEINENHNVHIKFKEKRAFSNENS